MANAANYLDVPGLFELCVSKVSQGSAIDFFKSAVFLQKISQIKTLFQKFPAGWKNDAVTLSSFTSQEMQYIVALMDSKHDRLNVLLKWAKSQSEVDVVEALLKILQKLSSKNSSLIALNHYQYKTFRQPLIDSISNSTKREYYGENFRKCIDSISTIVQSESTIQELTRFIIEREYHTYDVNLRMANPRSFTATGFELEQNDGSSENQAARSDSAKSPKLNLFRQYFRQPLEQTEAKSMQPKIRQSSKDGTIKWTLLFRASEHDFKTEVFHKYCDNKGPTITFVKTLDGDTFAGYAGLSWNTLTEIKSNPKGFIAEISNSKLRKYDASNTASIYCHLHYGPSFKGSY